MSVTTHQESLRELAAQIATQNLPAFGASLSAVTRVMSNSDASGQQLAEVILRDPALTASVLRAANSVLVMGSMRTAKIYTVSRAIVVLGMNALEAICVASLAVEHLQTQMSNAQRVQEVVGRAVHCAAQARNIAERRGAAREDCERLFVEAMLSHVGEMAFWCFGGEHAVELDKRLAAGIPQVQAEKLVLGAPMKDFSQELLKFWGLAEAIKESREVVLAEEIARESPKGWDSPGYKEALSKVSGHLNRPPREVDPWIRKNAQQAASFARTLGLRAALKFIPAAPETSGDAEDLASKPFGEPDAALQVKVISEMMRLLDGNSNYQALFEICLEGLHRAVGLDRVALLLLNPARTEMSARMELLVGTASLKEHLRLAYSTQVAESLMREGVQHFHAKAPRPMWLAQAGTVSECLIGTVSVDGRVLGLIYADRHPSGRSLDAEAVEGFRMFLRQLDLVGAALRRASAAA